MSKPPQRWPLWKIAAGTAGCAVASGALIWLSRYMERPGTGDAARTGTMTPAAFLLMVGVMSGILTVLGAIWLVLRVREARKPAWERRPVKPSAAIARKASRRR